MLTASADGVTSGTQTETITPGPAVSLTITPASATVPARASREFAASRLRCVRKRVPGDRDLVAVTARRSARIAPTTGSTTTFTASRTLGDGTITAALVSSTGTLSATAAVRVTPGRLRIESITYRKAKGGMAYVTVTARDATGKSISRAVVSLRIRRDGRPHYAKRVTTGPAGRTVFRMPVRSGGCFTTTITIATATGFVWDRNVPRNRYCRPRSTSH